MTNYTAILPNSTQVPNKLSQLDRWVGWKNVNNRKLPMDGNNGKMADVSDRVTWTTLDSAKSTAARLRWDGVGFVFTDEDELVGIDLDGCIENGQISPVAQWIIERTNTYTEVSPSGRGLHIIGAGTIDYPTKKDKEGIEIYGSKRYFTITGERVESTPAEINDIQGFLDNDLRQAIIIAGGVYRVRAAAPRTGNNVLYSTAVRLYRTEGLDESLITDALSVASLIDGRRTEIETRGTLESAKRRAEQLGILARNRTANAPNDFGHSQVLASLFMDEIRWEHERKSWYKYEQGHWRVISEYWVENQAVKRLSSHYNALLDSAGTKKEKTQYTIKVAEAASITRVSSALRILKGEDGVLTTAEDWNMDPWMLNCVNGTLDLRSGELMPHDPDNLITKLAPVYYEENETAERWNEHLKLFIPDEDVRRQIQRDLGRSLIGTTRGESLAIWYGIGANGKSTTSRIISAVLGDYAQKAAPGLLLRKKFDNHPTEIADLAGSRLVFSVEIEQGRQLNESLVKDLTGGDPIKARFMRGDFFEFEQSFTIILITNHKPEIVGTDEGIWRRVMLIPWEYTLPGPLRRSQDEVVSELMMESSGILNWMMDGLRDTIKNPHWTAEAVIAATAKYREDADGLSRFISDTFEVGTTLDYRVPVAEFNFRYQDWCQSEGEDQMTGKALAPIMRERGFTQKVNNGVKYWFGIRLKRTAPESGDLSDISGIFT